MVIECKICGKKLRAIGSHLFIKHGLSVKEYLLVFPDERIFSKKQLKKMGERSLGIVNREKSKAKMSRTLKKSYQKTPRAKYPPLEEIKENIRKARLEKKQAEKDARAQIADEIKFYNEHPEQREKMSRRLEIELRKKKSRS